MTKTRIILSSLLVLFGVQTPQLAQESATPAINAEHARHVLAITFLRAINTAEVSNKFKNGAYDPWQTLVSRQSSYFDKFLKAKGRDLHFKEAPEVLPGWNLRLNVHTDGQGYDVLLRDITDKNCGYAALTDETGVIRQSKAIDCEI